MLIDLLVIGVCALFMYRTVNTDPKLDVSSASVGFIAYIAIVAIVASAGHFSWRLYHLLF